MKYTTTTNTRHEELKKEYKYVISHNCSTTNNGFFFKGTGYNDDNINNVLEAGGSIFEYIGLNSKVKPYIDYEDYDYETNDYKKCMNTERPRRLKKIINIFIKCCNSKLGCDFNIDNIVILDGSRKVNYENKECFKYSFHITTRNNNNVFNTQGEAKQIHYLMKETERELYGVLKYCMKNTIDPSVYGKTQHMRTINGFKNKLDTYKLLPIDVNGNKIEKVVYIDYLINYTSDDYKLIVSNAEPVSNAVNVCDFINDDTNVHKTITDEKEIKEHNGEKFIIDYKLDITELLRKKGIINPLYKKGKVYNNTYNYYYTYGNNTGCIYGNKTHTRNERNNAMLYTYECDGVVFCGCFGAECAKKKKVILGSLLVKSPLEDSNYAEQVNEPKLTINKNNKVNELMNEFIKNDNKKVVCIKSRCGTGKTHTMCEYINKYITEIKPDARILMISTRQSYARAMCYDMKTKHNTHLINYLDYKEEGNDINELKNESRICISLESLHYVLKDWKPYDIVIFDESESICRHIFSTTIKGGELRTYGHLQDLINYSKKVFVLDADLGNASMKLMAKVPSSKFTLINNTYNENHRQYNITQNEKEWMNDIKSNILNNKRLFIVVLSKKRCIELSNELKVYVNQYNDMNGIKSNPDDVKLITGGMGSIEKKNMMNVNDDWSKSKIVITNSATGAGIDFSKTLHFDYIYGRLGVNEYACGISTPAEFIQICHRVRNPINNTINILSDSKMRLPYVFNTENKKLDEPNGSSFIYTIDNSKKYIDCIKDTVIKDEILKSIYNVQTGNIEQVLMDKDLDFSYLQYCEYLNTRLNNGLNNYLLVLKTLIERHGDICTIEPIKYKQVRTKNDKLRNIYNDTKFEDETAEHIYMKKEKTAKDVILFDKHKMIKTLNIDTKYKDDDLLEVCKVFTNSTDLGIYKNVKRIHMTQEREIKERNKKENVYFDSVLKKVQQNTANVYRRIIHYSKYDYTKDYKLDVKQFNEMFNKLHISQQEKLSISNRTALNPPKLVKTVLCKYGIVMTPKYKRTKADENSDVKRVNELTHYILNPSEKIYNVLYLEIGEMDDYKQPFMNQLKTYTKHKDLLIVKQPIKNMFKM